MTVRKIYGMIQHASGQAAFPSGHPEMLLVRIWSGAKNEAFSRNNAESVIQVVPSGGPTHCHPEFSSGSGFDLISAQGVFVLKRSAGSCSLAQSGS